MVVWIFSSQKSDGKKLIKVTTVQSSEHNKTTVQSSEHDKNKQTKTTEVKHKKDDDFKFENQYKSVLDLLKTSKEQYHKLSSEVKKLELFYYHDVKKVKKQKPKRNGNHKPTGFAKPQAVPFKLAKFIGVESGTELTGPEITKKVWAQMRAKNLIYDKDKRVFRTNKEITDVFGVPESVNTSVVHDDKNGFNFCNLQRFIAAALKN